MKLLLVEDNKELADNIKTYLELDGWDIKIIDNGITAFEETKKSYFDCIVLDLNLPGQDGINLCSQIRQNNINYPIIILTARTSNESVIGGLNIGADDYVKKPFEMEELKARIKALSRRNNNSHINFFSFEDIEIDLNKKEVQKDKKFVSLSPKEYLLLEFLIKNKNKVKTRVEILEEVWGDNDDLIFSQTVDVHVAYIRKKLSKNIIKTRHGGYIITDNND